MPKIAYSSIAQPTFTAMNWNGPRLLQRIGSLGLLLMLLTPAFSQHAESADSLKNEPVKASSLYSILASTDYLSKDLKPNLSVLSTYKFKTFNMSDYMINNQGMITPTIYRQRFPLPYTISEQQFSIMKSKTGKSKVNFGLGY